MIVLKFNVSFARKMVIMLLNIITTRTIWLKENFIKMEIMNLFCCLNMKKN